MPTNRLTVSGFTINGGGSLARTDLTYGNPSASFTIGTGFTKHALDLTDGTGSGNANEVYVARNTITTGANLDLDLSGALTNPLGQTIVFTGIKVLLVQLAAASMDGTNKVRVGPAGVTNAWQGPWGGTGATVYHEVYEALYFATRYGAWAVTAGTADILRITNPGASSVTVDVLLIGTK